MKINFENGLEFICDKESISELEKIITENIKQGKIKQTLGFTRFGKLIRMHPIEEPEIPEDYKLEKTEKVEKTKNKKEQQEEEYEEDEYEEDEYEDDEINEEEEYEED